MTDTVLLDSPDPGVTTLTLNRPASLNALTHELIGDLHEALDQIEADDACRVVLLTGSGRAFCAGLDLKGYGDGAEPGTPGWARDANRRQQHIASVITRLRDLRQPVVAVVNGPAAGAGLSFAAASDIRLASSTAVFSAAYLRAGFTGCDLGSSWLLPRLIGAGRTHELLLTARRVDVEEALRIGLVTSVHAPDELFDAARALAGQVMLGPPLSVEMTKRGMWAGVEAGTLAAAMELENRLQVITTFTQDQAEATNAFLEKRPPRYLGR